MDEFLSGSSELLIHELSRIGEFSFIAGIDEAGRGCCAGPVCAASVMFTDFSRIPAGVMDSKQLTHARRMALRERIINESTAIFGIGMADAHEIDEINILQAAWLAMRRAVEAMPVKPAFLLVDGNPVKGLPFPSQSIVKGDAKSASIAAASILAKTTRDILMMEMAEKYPEYRFEVHKGYCTELHKTLLRKYGPCPIHRLSYAPVQEAIHPPEQIQQEFQF